MRQMRQVSTTKRHRDDEHEHEEVRSDLGVLFAKLPSQTLGETLEGRLRCVVRGITPA
jgi:hypothetical protein